MSGTINTHLQDLFLEKFFSLLQSKDFYLTGGTALSRFYFYHRESVDLDFFTNNHDADFSLVNSQIIDISQKLNLKINEQILGETYLQYIFENNDGINLKVDFLRDNLIHFGEIKLFGGTRVDSLENIAVNKIMAIIGRTDAKDFIDLYFLINQSGFNLESLISLAKEKELGYSDFYFANALSLIENVQTYPVMIVPLNKEELKKYFLNLSKELFLKIKPAPSSV